MKEHIKQEPIIVSVPERAQNTQNEDQYVQNIQIYCQNRENILFRRNAELVCSSHDHLDIVHQVKGEQCHSKTQVAYNCNPTIHGTCQNSEQNEHDEGHEQTSSHAGKIPLGLASEQCQRHTDYSGRTQGYPDLVRLIETSHQA